jgi:hypothetical protein
MESEERIVGFDAREMWLDPAASWTEQRRTDFLFRPDVPKPLSTDTGVWPSVFDLNGNTRPPDCFGHQDLCEELAAVQSHLRDKSSVRAGHSYLVAITVLLESTKHTEVQEWDALLTPTVPAVRENSWSFLGFDVSDQWLLSGLSNCGFLPEVEDVSELKRTWGPQLNQHHLFNALAPATAFKNLSNERVKEHAPFFVFGIWLIEEYLDKEP